MNRQFHWIWGTIFQLVGPLISIPFPKKTFVGGSSELGFFSMRNRVIYEQKVNFQEHQDKTLWVAWSHGPWSNILRGSYGTLLLLSV
jgi:hypothetical protein